MKVQELLEDKDGDNKPDKGEFVIVNPADWKKPTNGIGVVVGFQGSGIEVDLLDSGEQIVAYPGEWKFYKKGSKTKPTNEAIASTADNLYSSLSEMLYDAEEDLEDLETTGSSHSIGGNMRAVVSGEVKIVKNYSDTGYAGSRTHWDLCLQVGNGIEGGDALKKVQAIYADAIKEAKDHDPKKFDNFDGVFHAYFDDGSVSCKYEYARAFCWIAIRKNAK